VSKNIWQRASTIHADEGECNIARSNRAMGGFRHKPFGERSIARRVSPLR